MKGIYKIPTAIILKDLDVYSHYSCSIQDQRVPDSTINTRKGNRRNDIVSLENPKDFTDELLELISEF